jgi:hypothetical protein
MVESPTPQIRPFVDDRSDLVQITEVLQRSSLRSLNTRTVSDGLIHQVVKMLVEFGDRAPRVAR